MVSIFTMLATFQRSLPGLYKLVAGGSVLVGFWFTLRGIYQLRMYGELRTMMSLQTEIKGPLLFLFTGIVLIYWPTLFHMSMKTLFGYTNPITYQSGGIGANYSLTMQLAGNVIRFIGFIAFIRGWVLLTAYGQQHQQHGIGKAITHIVGGILAINIFATWQILKNTFGI